jgi:protein TonB
MNDYAQRQRNPRRLWMSLCAVVALHLLLLWAISSGLATKFVKIAKAPVEAMLLEEIPPVLPPPPPPPVQPPPKTLPPPPAYVPPAVVPVNTPPPVNAIAAVSSKPQPETPPAPAPVVAAPPSPLSPPSPVARTAAVGILCSKPEYPNFSIRMEEEGIVALSYVVGVDGTVIKVDIVKSSGYKRLDAAASQQVLKWRFKPATLDGKPIEQTITKSMRFSLSNEEATSSKEQAIGC